MCDHYRTLGINKDATKNEIRDAYSIAARNYQDAVDADSGAQEEFQRLQEAYEILSDPVKRQLYDASQEREDEEILVEVDTIYSSETLVRLDEPQRVYAMVTIRCKSSANGYQRTPANICLVVDRSTSMKENRLEIMKRNILNIFDRLSSDDVFSLITFNDRAEVVIPSTTAINLPSLKKSILGLTADGGTEIFQGLIRGYQMLSQSIRKAESRYLMLLTDGHTYGDESSCYSMARQAAQEGIVIQGMGIGHEWNDRFLDRLTSISGGCAQYISTPEDLQQILDRQLQALESVYAQQLKFSFKKPDDISIGTVFRLSPDSAPMSTESPVSLGNLEYDREQVLLFEFLVPPQEESKTGVELANGEISMKLSGGDKLVQVPCRLYREYADTASEAPPPDRMMRAVSRLTLYRLQAKAHSALLERNVAEATRYLQSLATHLLSQGNHGLARTVLREAESIRKHGEFSKYGEKNLKYGTRALMLPEDEGER
ncbi:MAG: VWA domain-containing protein [Anaerolineaceae bacterium]|jgi:Ca-activated chloride channel family protein|nr:VWA domain-containing protein [Anaerolineaceae bacterium]